MTIAENVAVVPKLLGWKAPRVNERIEELLHLAPVLIGPAPGVA
jgi:ABC-type proline/glycine betaine transport system ATPase subunit